MGMTLETEAGEMSDATAAPLRTSPLSARLSHEEAQQLRIKRFFLAAATSIVALALFFACYVAGLINISVLLAAAAMTLAFMGAFYTLFRTSLNLRFAD